MLISDPVFMALVVGMMGIVYTAGLDVSRISCYVSPKIKRTLKVWRPTVKRRGREGQKRRGRRRRGSYRERRSCRKDGGRRWDLEQSFSFCAKSINTT